MVAIDSMLTKHREAFLYIICGGLTTLVTWGTYAIFVNIDIGLNTSNILSWICGILFAFVVNKWIVFSSKSVNAKTLVKELGSFFSARLLTGIIAILLFPVLYNLGINQSILGTDGFIAKIITSVIEIGLNWIFSKYYIFKHETNIAP